MLNEHRGRPVVFFGQVKQHILDLIIQHGILGSRKILNDENISISLPTLGKFAKEAKISLQRGRPKIVARISKGSEIAPLSPYETVVIPYKKMEKREKERCLAIMR